MIALTGAVMLYALLTRTNSHLSVLHVRAPLYTQAAEGGIRDGYTLRFSNKLSEPTDFVLEVSGIKGAVMTSDVAKRLPDGRLGVRVDPDATLEVPVYVSTPADANPGASTPITFTAIDAKTGERSVVVDHFFGP